MKTSQMKTEFVFWDEQCKNIPNKRRSKEEGHMAQLVRRKMIQKDHGDNSKYTRKAKHKNDK